MTWQRDITRAKDDAKIDQQKQVAALLGVPEKTVSSWFLGKTAPPTEEKRQQILRRIRAFATGADTRPASPDRRAGMLYVIDRLERELQQIRADIAAAPMPTATAPAAAPTMAESGRRAAETVQAVADSLQRSAAVPAKKASGRKSR